jgi:hypothetical protein
MQRIGLEVSVIDGGLWRPANNLPYQHGITSYGGNIVDIIGVAPFGRYLTW